MGLNIGLFIHGVPMGQKMYGPKGEDQMYINSFYGPKWDVPELLKVDVMTFGGTTYCYYSFVKGVDVCDSQGRAGSYFALTLRINALYVDFQNVYSILKAAYAKMCVGLCVKDDGNVVKYLVPEFDSVETQLKLIEQHIINYISEFSLPEDIVSASGLKSNSTTLPIVLNLHECTQQVGIRNIQAAGKLQVSPYYPSSQAAQQIAMCRTEMQNVQQRARQDIEDTSRSYEEKMRLADALHQHNLQECKEQAEVRVRKIKEEGDQRVSEINARYADADLKIENLKKEKTQIEKEKKILQTQLKEKDDSISKLEKLLDRRDDDIEKMKRQMEDMKNLQEGQEELPFPNMKKALSYLVLFFVIAFVVLGAWFAWDHWASEKASEPFVNTLENVKENTTTAEANEALPIEPIVASKIHIQWGKTEGSICPNETLQLEFGGDENLFAVGAEWYSDELVIKDNKISVKSGCKSDSCRLSLMLEGKEIDFITIQIQK